MQSTNQGREFGRFVEAWPDREFPIGQSVGGIALNDNAILVVCESLLGVSKEDKLKGNTEHVMTHNGQDLVGQRLAGFRSRHELA